MRRPSPLPQAPRTAAAGETVPDVATPHSVDPLLDDVAPAAPDSERSEHDDVAAAVGAAWGDDPWLAAPRIETPRTVTGVDDVAGPVRRGDVWRAARARRKALRGEVRRFTGRARRRRAVWITASAAFVVLVVATVGVAYSPLLALERISVVGTTTLSADAVEEALAGELGTPLPLVDESAVKQALVAFPLVESYTLEARPPHDLVVRIVERTPIGVVKTDAGWSLVDAAGVVLETTAEAPEGRAVVDAEGGTDSDAFEAIARVMRALPDDILARVTGVEAATRDDVTLTFGATGSRVVWGSDADSATKALVLAQAMEMRPPETASVYDVSTPSAIVIR